MHSLLDDVARILASPLPRRRALKLVSGALAGGILAALDLRPAAAQNDAKPKCPPRTTKCGTGSLCCSSTQTCCTTSATPFCATQGKTCCGKTSCSSGQTCCKGVCCGKNQVCKNGRCQASRSIP